MTEKFKLYAGIDIYKYVMAVLILSVHCNLFHEYSPLGEIWYNLTEIAVPSFFAFSAFLFFSRLEAAESDDEKKAIFRHTAKRQLILYLVWLALMLLWSYTHIWKYANFNQFLYILLLGSGFPYYWFIKALIINTFILFIFRWGQKPMIILAVVSSIVYFLCMILRLTSFGAEIILWLKPYNSFYSHTYSFAFGALIARYYNQIPQLLKNSYFLVICLILTFVFSFAGGMTHGTVSDKLSVFLYSEIVLLLALQYKGSISSSLSQKLRVLSILYYMLQFALIFAFDAMFEGANSIIRFVFILFILTGASLFIIWLEKFPKFSFLKYLH